MDSKNVSYIKTMLSSKEAPCSIQAEFGEGIAFSRVVFSLGEGILGSKACFI